MISDICWPRRGQRNREENRRRVVGVRESVCGVERESETERARESRGGYGDSHLWSRSSFPKLLLHL